MECGVNGSRRKDKVDGINFILCFGPMKLHDLNRTFEKSVNPPIVDILILRHDAFNNEIRFIS